MFLFLLPIAVHPQSNPCDEKKYTVKEIRDLRNVCENIYLFGTSLFGGTRFSRVYKEVEKVVAVEQMVRTYILAGITAKDIRDEDEKELREQNSLNDQETK